MTERCTKCGRPRPTYIADPTCPLKGGYCDWQEPICHDYGERAGCLRQPDWQWTMRFDDLGEPPIYWCAACGPEAHEINRALEKALERPEFAEGLRRELERVERERKEGSH